MLLKMLRIKCIKKNFIFYLISRRRRLDPQLLKAKSLQSDNILQANQLSSGWIKTFEHFRFAIRQK